MASIIGKLTALLYADTAEFDKGMKRASKSLRRFERDMTEVAGKATKGLAAGLGIAGAALTALTLKSANLIDEQAKMSRSLGTTLRGFQALSLVFKESGLDQGALAQSLTLLQKELIGAAQGAKSSQRAFDTLGLSVSGLLKLSPDQQFLKVGQALAKIKNPTERTALALEIFGKSGRAIIPVLEDLNIAVQDSAEFQKKFNISLDEIDARKVEEAGDTVGRVGDVFIGLGNTIAVKLSPIVTELGNAFINSGLDGKKFGELVSGGISLAADGIDLVKKSFASLQYLFYTAEKNITKFYLNATKGAYDFAKALEGSPIFGGAASSMAQKMLELNETQQAHAQDVKKSLSELIDESNKYISTQEKIDAIDKKATERATKKEATGISAKRLGIEPDLAFASNADKRKKVEDIFADLDRESQQLRIQVDLYGQKESIIERAQKQLEIETELKKEGIALDEKQKASLNDRLNALDRQKSALESLGQIQDIVKYSVSDIADAFTESGKAADKFRNVAVNALNRVAKVIIENFANGMIGGQSAGGGLFGSIGAGISGFFGNVFKNILPSFDVGSTNIPRDMTANIHKGEMIIPAAEAEKIRSGKSFGGGSVSIVQNITIGASVSAAVRQEVSKLMPELKKASVEAVTDARLRGAT